MNTDADVIVCGGGPAGVTAGRARATVRLDKLHGALGGPWEGVQIAATLEQIGIRDGRRIKGRCFMTSEDLLKRATQRRPFSIVVCGSPTAP